MIVFPPLEHIIRSHVGFLCVQDSGSCTGYLGYLFYSLPLHVAEQQGEHGVAPWQGCSRTHLSGMTRRPERAICPHAVEAGAIIGAAVLVPTHAGSEPARWSPSKWLMRVGLGALGCAERWAPAPLLSAEQAPALHPSSEAHPTRLAPVSRGGASRVCSVLPC